MKSFGAHLKYIIQIFVVLAFTISACHDEAVKLCEPLKSDLIGYNVPDVKATLNPWLNELKPYPTEFDPTGHEENLSVFTERLKNSCDLDVRVRCYACIETYPAQSEIIVWLDSAGINITRVLDIETPESKVMKIKNIHS